MDSNIIEGTNQGLWEDCLASLRGKLLKQQYDWFEKSSANQVGNTLIIQFPPDANVEMIRARLCRIVEETVHSIYGELDIELQKIAVQDIVLPVDVYPDDDEDESPPDAEFSGIYHDKRNAIIQPDKLEIHTQYFRNHWRRLLGPMLSELVRELRQRCHYKTGRNTFKTTYKSLANTLGVSEPTVKRALKRDKDGNFTNEYLGSFIASMDTDYQRKDGKVRATGTRFAIYLDEPLTPQHQAENL